MEFLCYLLGGITDLIVLIILLILRPLIIAIDSQKLNTFVNEILTGLVERLF